MTSTKQVVDIINEIADKIEENKLYLTELDASIGDGDHGLNLSKGFGAVKEAFNKSESKDIGDVLKKTGMALVSNVGGASGPLYGTAFMKAAVTLSGKQEMNIQDFTNALKAAIDGIKLRGKAVLGEKTMLDALLPAYEKALSLLEKGETHIKVLEEAWKAAEKGALATEGISATKGRASYLGDRSIGHRDPGAASAAIILKTIYEAVCSFNK
ncbi:dihydroxyacetone kinase subunit L [Clostridium sp. 19966]|uniref:dihydroxyacetone kinase subunit DhaL n=1 Tax=Clostridium sp. 19966 TaxID=2768166 RepID=UPI0028DEDACF|nr:dihydroxyacetone kinase subunit DhaL [Clostridium sp. 19966]MDT8716919.1 dihydroxyacetone kinase subunit L [Clostridium sp. 19966]